MAITVLLGPQRLGPTVAPVARQLGLSGPVGLVTAGWQELESADYELREHLATDVVNLELYRRAEEVFAEDQDLAEAHRRRQDRLRALQSLHRVRLRHTLDAARQLMGRHGDSDDLDVEREAALRQLTELDTEHAERLQAVHSTWDHDVRPGERPSVARHRADVAELLEACQCLPSPVATSSWSSTGSGFSTWLGYGEIGPVVAWSAGAMALARRVFAYHDNPPQGPANTEVLENGLARYRSVQPFPHAKRRLRLDDPVRTSVLARRMVAGGGGPARRERMGRARRGTSHRPQPGAASHRRRVGETDRANVMMTPTVRRLRAAARRGEAALQRFLERHRVPIQGEGLTTFVFVGEADKVDLDHWIYGLPGTQPFDRVPGTTLWHLSVDLPAESRIEYKLGITRNGHRDTILDPLNPRRAHDPFGANSVCSTEGYQFPEWAGLDPGSRPGSIEDLEIDSAALRSRRTLHVYLPARFRAWAEVPAPGGA